jgi:hypothetical protein
MPTGPKVGKGRRRRQKERSLRDGLPKTWNGFEAFARTISGKPRRRTTPIRNPSRAGDIYEKRHDALEALLAWMGCLWFPASIAAASQCGEPSLTAACAGTSRIRPRRSRAV